MNKTLLTLFSFFLVVSVFAQSNYKVKSDLKTYKQWKVDFSEDHNLLELARLKDGEVAPAPRSHSDEVKRALDAQRQRKIPVKSKTSYVTTKDDVKPELAAGWNGRPLGGSGVPNDNSMAISNDGIVVSVINTTATILDSDGNMLKFRTLSGIVAGQLGTLDRFYDPKVTYDPINDRFILVFLEGSNSSDTRIVVGFTETNDPTGIWNFYALDGRPLGGAKWSDYPIIAHNATDLYITVNLLRDNESWQEGFEQSFIWQVNKEDGYQGNTLRQNLFYDIEYDNKPVWSICPVQPALDFNQDNMYFLSVRPDASSNDTLFLHEITNSSTNGSAEHKLTVLQADAKYGVPPTAFQPRVGFRLQTNDTRVLSATQHRGNIHYTQSTIVQENLSSGIYHGIITDVTGSATVSGEIISSTTMDYAYPSIAFAGNTADDEHSMVITFSHVGEDDYPGTSAVFHNKKTGLDRLYSDVVMVKEGDSLINTFVADTSERWGDYTDIQPKYNEPGVVWLCGSYGDERGQNNVWIAKLKVNNELISVDGFITYPNPTNASVKVGAVFEQDGLVTLRLTDMQGKIVKELKDEPVTKGSAEFLMNTTGMSSGMYILSVYNSDQEKLYSEKLMVE
jgi:hypothetical protein